MLAAGIVLFGMFKALFGKDQWNKALRFGVAGLAVSKVYEKATGESLLDKAGITSSENKSAGTPGGVESSLVQSREKSLKPVGFEQEFLDSSAKVRSRIVSEINDIPAEQILGWEEKYRENTSLKDAPKNLAKDAPKNLTGIYIDGVNNSEILGAALGFIRLSYKNSDFRENPNREVLTLENGRRISHEALDTISKIEKKDKTEISFGEVLLYLQQYEEMTVSTSADRRLDQKALTFLTDMGESISPFVGGMSEYTAEKAKQWYIKLTSIYAPEIVDTLTELMEDGWRAAENGFDEAKGTLRFVRENYRIEISAAGDAVKIVFVDLPIGAVTTAMDITVKSAKYMTEKYDEIKKELDLGLAPQEAEKKVSIIDPSIDLAKVNKEQLQTLLSPVESKIKSVYGFVRDADYEKFLQTITEENDNSSLSQIIRQKFGANPDETQISQKKIAQLFLNPDFFFLEWLQTAERWGKKGANTGSETLSLVGQVAGFFPAHALDIGDNFLWVFPESGSQTSRLGNVRENQIGSFALDEWKAFWQNAKFDIPQQSVDFRATEEVLRVLGNHNISQNSESKEVIWTTEMLNNLALIAIIEKVLGKQILIPGYWGKDDNWKQIQNLIQQNIEEIKNDPNKKAQATSYAQRIESEITNSGASLIDNGLTPKGILLEMKNIL